MDRGYEVAETDVVEHGSRGRERTCEKRLEGTNVPNHEDETCIVERVIWVFCGQK